MSSPPCLVDAGDFRTLSRSGPSQTRLKRLRSKTNVQDEERQGPAERTPYLEAQRELMCGVHALNHAVGFPQVCSQDLDEAVDVAVAEAHACAAEVGEKCEEAGWMHIEKGRYYSEQAMAGALNKHGVWKLDQTPLKLQEHGVATLWQSDVVGAIVHLPGHWVALRREGDAVWWLDSLRPGPDFLGTNVVSQCLQARLRNIDSIFVIREKSDADHQEIQRAEEIAAEVKRATAAATKAETERLRDEEQKRAAAAAAEAEAARLRDEELKHREAEAQQEAEPEIKLAAAAVATAEAARLRAEAEAQFQTQEAEAAAHKRTAVAAKSAEGDVARRRFVARAQTAEQERFMLENDGVFRVTEHAKELLNIYLRCGPDRVAQCKKFLAELPLFSVDTSLADIASEFDTAVRILTEDHVNSAATLQVRTRVADTATYPLLVLMEATAQAEAIPSVFYVDQLHTLLHSLLHSSLHVRLGRWKSKSRHWSVGTANVGEGKSPSMKGLVDAVVEVLQRHASLADGTVQDRFHLKQSGTTADALAKMRQCNARLLVYCSDAGRCLCPTAKHGGATDPHKFMDLEFFLDATHGDEVSHSNKVDRERILKVRVGNPQGPVLTQPGLHMEPTNVHIMFMQQDVFFTNWWAQLTAKKPVGLGQRCLFAFGGDMDPAPRGLTQFREEVTVPVVAALLERVLRRVGPKTTVAEELSFKISEQQASVLTELEAITKVHARRAELDDALPAAMPKSSYWLGTGVLSNHIVSQLWRSAVLETEPPRLDMEVTDETFGTSVIFVYRRYHGPERLSYDRARASVDRPRRATQAERRRHDLARDACAARLARSSDHGGHCVRAGLGVEARTGIDRREARRGSSPASGPLVRALGRRWRRPFVRGWPRQNVLA